MAKKKEARPLKIVIADDHEVVRAGLKNVLAGTEIKIVGEATTGEQAVKLTLKHKPDLVLLDVRMPDMDGLTALGRIKLEHPDLPVLILSTYDTPAYVARAVALGAAGYVMKGIPREKLIEAIRQGASGKLAWSREELRRASGALTAPRNGKDADVPLTQRESEVLLQLTEGLTNKEIADVLKISYETVKEHVQHLLRKIGVTDRTQAAVWAVRKGLV